MNSHNVVAAQSNFVASIRGIELGETLPPSAIETIRSAFQKFGVLVFPNQHLNIEQLEQFTLCVGEFGKTDFVEPIEGHPNVVELRREADEVASHFGAQWHTDLSYQPSPPAATILYARKIPPVGGDTLFADGQAAYLALDDAWKRRLADLKAVHSAGMVYSSDGYFGPGDDPSRSMKVKTSDQASEQSAIHPLVRTHPESNQKVLWFNVNFVSKIDGLSEADSQEVIKFLAQYSTRPEFVYRHRWSKDMLIMWDNRRVQHFADGGFDGYQRIMWRTTTAGTVPY